MPRQRRALSAIGSKPWLETGSVGQVTATLSCLVIFIGLSHQSVVLGGPKVGCQCYLIALFHPEASGKQFRKGGDVIESQVVPSLTPLLWMLTLPSEHSVAALSALSL